MKAFALSIVHLILCIGYRVHRIESIEPAEIDLMMFALARFRESDEAKRSRTSTPLARPAVRPAHLRMQFAIVKQ